MREALIAIKYPKKRIPDDVILKALELYPTAGGFSCPLKGIIERTKLDPNEIDMLDSIGKIQDSYADHQLAIHLVNTDEATFGLDDMQPFELITNANKDSILDVMIEGVLTEYIRDEGSPAFNFVNEYLYEEIEALYDMCGQDMAKLLAKLDADALRKEMRAKLQPQGSILFIPAVGKLIAYSESKLGKEYDWGFLSNTMGYIEPEKKTTTTPAVDPGKALTFKEKAALKASGQQSTTVPTVKPPLTLPTKVEPPKDSPFFEKQVDGKTVLWVRPRAGTGWDEAKKMWNANCSYNRPKEAKDVMLGFPASKLKPDAPLRKAAMALGLIVKDTAMREAMAKAETTTKTAGAAVDNEDALDRENALVVTADEKSKFLVMYKAGIPSMEDVAKEVAEYPKYSEQVACPQYKLLTAKPRAFIGWDKPALINFINELRMELYQVSPEKFDAPEEEEQPETTVEPVEKKLTFKERAALKQQAA